MNIFKLVGQLVVEGTDEAKKGINEVTEEAEGSSSKLGGVLTTIGGMAQALATATVAVVGATATAIVGVTKSAVDAYGQYEQLVGGVETLFGDSAGKVLEYAQNAYKTAGMSANQYMETVTSFTASLLQGLDGDTARGAEIANLAIQDMADNANKMGTSIEMIQHAYQGFAKDNFMMLDNLKLGYGGTAGEMARLINETGVMGEAFEATAKNVKDVPLDKMIEAIHKVQVEMGITGTTASEASGTLQGSMSAVKAQWSNILVALADDNQNLEGQFNILVENLLTAMGNMIPRIKIVLDRIPQLVATAMPLVVDKFNGMMTSVASTIQANFPIVVEKSKELMSKIGEKLKENIPIVASKALDMLSKFSQKFLENVPSLVASGMDMIKNIVQGLVNALPTLIQKAPQIIINFANTISRSMQVILMKGAEIIWELIKGIVKAIPALKENFPKVIEAIFAVWNAINWMNLGKNLVSGIANGIKNMGTMLKNTAKNLFTQLKNNTSSIFTSIKTAITSPITSAKNLFSGAVTGIKNLAINGFNSLRSSASSIFNKIKTAITSPIKSARDTIKNIVKTIKGFFNFKISLPKIPMPHFSVNPSGWKLSDLLKGSIPTLGISWYAKAMDKGVILDKPTIFGEQNGKLLGAGEAGSETVVGTDSLMSMIQQAVLQSNARQEEILNKIYFLLNAQMPALATNRQVVLDTGVLVGQITPKVDAELGVIKRLKARR